MMFMVEPKGTTRPERGESQASVDDRATGPDILCFTGIGGGKCILLEPVQYYEDAVLPATLSLRLTEAKDLHAKLGAFIKATEG
jgi:hypothetical protein